MWERNYKSYKVLPGLRTNSVRVIAVIFQVLKFVQGERNGSFWSKKDGKWYLGR